MRGAGSWFSRKDSKERVIAFTDAIIAFAITLLVLSFSVEQIGKGGTDEASILKGIMHQLPTLASFVISFFVIAAFWQGHVFLCNTAKRFDRVFSQINLIFVLLIVFLPFTTDMHGEYSHSKIVVSIYVANIAFAFLALGILFGYILRKKDFLAQEGAKEQIARSFRKDIGVGLLLLASTPILFAGEMFAQNYWIAIIAIVIIGTRLIK